MIEVEDQKAFEQYQLFHNTSYGHICHITFEPLTDLDEALAPVIAELKAKS